MLSNKNIFYQIDKRYYFKTIIFSKEDTSIEGVYFLQWVKKDMRWGTIYEDPFTIILIKRDKVL